MFRPALRTAAAGIAIVFAAAPAPAQTREDRKPAIAKLFTDATEKANESTVRVRVNYKDIALGTVVDPAGYILTKGDELFERGKLRTPISVRLRDGSVYDASVVGYHRDTDLMMLKVDADLPAVSFSDSKKAVVGNFVAAPGGTESQPLAAGVISAGARKLYGEEAQITRGDRGYLGIRLDESKDQDGVVVTFVEPSSPALRAKIKKDDLIVRVAGKTVTDPRGLQKIMEDYRPGDEVVVSVKRGENELDLKVKLGTRAEFDRGAFQNKIGSDLSNRRTGFPSVIQHDMVLKPNECGGPLVDLDGNVLGINIARAGRVETWTLPGEVVRPLIKQFKDKKFALTEPTSK